MMLLNCCVLHGQFSFFTSDGSACETGQYLCGDGQCIDASLKCNGIQDCIDNSDEDWQAGCTSE